ncbi:MAG: FAD-binding domain-containing protein, partial [Phycisphaerales bacterium]
ILVAFPRVCRGRAFKPATERIEWREDAEQFEAWCSGRTGFPIVDAAMRQLAQTGFMHNRLRMVTAMFLTKDLFMDWRKGERFFMRHLVDGDLASNNGGWQWSASTGTDAAPYFRIFNPISQSRACDPEGTFIRRMVPEIAHLTGDAIHDPDLLAPLARAGLDYPAKIVERSGVRDRVFKAFKGIAG